MKQVVARGDKGPLIDQRISGSVRPHFSVGADNDLMPFAIVNRAQGSGRYVA